MRGNLCTGDDVWCLFEDWYFVNFDRLLLENETKFFKSFNSFVQKLTDRRRLFFNCLWCIEVVDDVADSLASSGDDSRALWFKVCCWFIRGDR